MLLNEICLTESVTFNVIFWNEEKKYWSSNSQKGKEECSACEGSGKNDLYDAPDEPCPYCKGEGTTEEWIDNNPEMNVSNANAGTILRDMLGINPHGEDGLTGLIPNDKLPAIKRKLIKLKNTDTSRHTEEPYEEPRNRVGHKQDDGTTRLGYDAPQIIHGGRSSQQVEQYIDRLMAIVDAAQKEGGSVSWG